MAKLALTPFLTVATLALFAVSPIRALAENGDVPSYATHDETIRGRITDFDGQFSLQVRDERGFVDSVRLHQGTIINPTGLQLATGLSVTILGHANGNVFDANEIDTPYEQDPGQGYSYGDAGYADPGPYYGYGCCYGYGYGYGYPYAFGLAFGFGGGYYGGGYGGYYGGGYGHGGYGHGGYGTNHGGYGGGPGGYNYGHGGTGGGYQRPSNYDSSRRYPTGYGRSGGTAYAGRSYGGSGAPRSYGGGTARSSVGGAIRSSGSFSSGGHSGGGGRR